MDPTDSSPDDVVLRPKKKKIVRKPKKKKLRERLRRGFQEESARADAASLPEAEMKTVDKIIDELNRELDKREPVPSAFHKGLPVGTVFPDPDAPPHFEKLIDDMTPAEIRERDEWYITHAESELQTVRDRGVEEAIDDHLQVRFNVNHDLMEEALSKLERTLDPLEKKDIKQYVNNLALRLARNGLGGPRVQRLLQRARLGFALEGDSLTTNLKFLLLLLRSSALSVAKKVFHAISRRVTDQNFVKVCTILKILVNIATLIWVGQQGYALGQVIKTYLPRASCPLMGGRKTRKKRKKKKTSKRKKKKKRKISKRIKKK